MRVVVSLLLVSALAFAADPDPNPFMSGWDKPVDPDKDCKFVKEKAGMTLTLPGKDHDLGVERGRMNAPRLLRDVEGDFVVQVRVGGDFTPSNGSTTTERVPFVGAGLVLMNGDNTYIRLERAALRYASGVKTYSNWELRKDGKWEKSGTITELPLTAKTTYLRLERKGDKLIGSVSEDGKTWKDMDPITIELPAKVKLGVAACTTSSEAFAPHYDQFKLTAKKMKKE
jgi:regulation of enolase protein 1 (concanavalin A-like superfamily)